MFSPNTPVSPGRFVQPAPCSPQGALCAEFGVRLRQMFDVPAEERARQDRFEALLRQIGEKLG